MPNLTTTLRVIDSHEICPEGWDAVCKTAGSDELDTKITLLQMLDADGIENAVWALRCWPEELSLYHFRADVADLVSHIYRDEYPNDTRVDDCIAMTHRYADGDATREELDAEAAKAVEAKWEAAGTWAAKAVEAKWEVAAMAAAAAAAWEVAAMAVEEAARATWARADTYEKIEKLLREYIAREY